MRDGIRYAARAAAWGAFAVLGTWISVCGSSRVAEGSDFSQFLHSVFGDNHRKPTATELNYYSNIYRTDGPLESLVRILATDDYYNNQCQRNPNTYVTRLYQILLRRDPTASERSYWAQRTPQSNANARLAFVRQFTQANNITYYYAPEPVVLPPPMRPEISRPQAAKTLVGKCDSLFSQVQTELGGTYSSRDLLIKLAVLSASARHYQETVDSSFAQADLLSFNFRPVQRYSGEAERAFRAVPAASSAARGLMWDISRLVADIAAQLGATPTRPPQRSPIEQEAGQLVAVVRQFAAVVAPYQSQGFYYTNLYRDASSLSVQAESLQQQAQAGADARALRTQASRILSQANDMSRRVADADLRVRQAWSNVRHEVDQLAGVAGIAGDLYVTPDEPVLLNHPAWSNFPLQPSSGYLASNDNRRLVDSIDELVRSIDAYVAAMRPYAATDRDAARMVDDALDLKNQSLVLRQQAASGAYGGGLQSESREALRLYTDVASQTFARMVGRRPELNSPQWAQIGQQLRAVDRSIGSASLRTP